MKILIISALSQEYSPFKSIFPSWREVRREPPRKFAFDLPDKEIILVESGMGSKAAKETLSREIAGFCPDLVIFSGFAGGLHPDLQVGEVCLAQGCRSVNSESAFRIQTPQALSDFLVRNHIRPVLALSAEAPTNKQALSTLVSGEPAVVDMETAVAAEVALDKESHFLCFRAVSDALGQRLGFKLSDISNEEGRIRHSAVLVAILRKPATLRAFCLAWVRSRRAALNLCRSVAAFLRIPAPILNKMADEIKIECE